MTRGFVLVCAALLLAGCAPANADGDRTITDTVGGQAVRIDLPTGDPVAVALWFHGQGGDVETRMNEDWLNSLRADGWAVASSDLHGNAWGNPASVADAAALAQWAEDQADVEVRLLVAGSMGGLTSLNALIDGKVSAACWYGTMPVADLDAIGQVPDAAVQVREAYEGASPDFSNPATGLADLPAVTRYHVVASPQDTWVPAREHADVLVAALQAVGAEVTRTDASGEHGDPSHFDPADLSAFADSCA